jgi:hypothetical protein
MINCVISENSPDLNTVRHSVYMVEFTVRWKGILWKILWFNQTETFVVTEENCGKSDRLAGNSAKIVTTYPSNVGVDFRFMIPCISDNNNE